MALQLILGGSGAGKSHYLYHKIIQESMEHPERTYLVIVPEQFTMETQKDFVRLHPGGGIMNIDVLSFERLAYRVFEETGAETRQVLEDTGKTLVLRKVLEEKKEELLYFKSNIKKPGFVDEIKSLLSEFYQYSIGEEELLNMVRLSGERPALLAKLQDMLVIYRGFRDYMRKKYITSEEILEVLSELAEQSRLVRDSVICMDGFTGFTPSQYTLLSRLFSLAKKVYITVTVDESEDISRVGAEYKLFYLSKKTIRRLCQVAEDTGCEIQKPIYPKKAKGQLYRFLGRPCLGALEHNLFRYPVCTYEGAAEQIHIHIQKNPGEEVRFVISTMLSLIREQGLRYRDFAVVSGDMAGYGRLLENGFKQAGIPCFLDDKRSILGNPYVVMLNGLLELFEKNFQYESVFHYLRSGMSRLEKEETDRLDNYTLAVGIRGLKKWKEPFTRSYPGMKEEELPLLNEAREKFLEEILPYAEVLEKKKHTVLAYTEALCKFSAENKAFETLCRYRDSFEAAGEPLRAREYSQVYTQVMKMLERLVELLGEEEVSRKEYKELLETGFGEIKVGLIPSGVDQVVVGDMERTRLKDVKVLFVTGVNDGIVPKAAGGGGILSDMERERLKKEKVELAPTSKEQTYTEQFYIYLNLTKPSRELYLTCAEVGNDGKLWKPSYLIGRISQIFPTLKIKNDTTFVEYSTMEEVNGSAQERESDFLNEQAVKENVKRMLSADQGMDYFLNGLRSFGEGEAPGSRGGKTAWNPAYWETLYSLYLEEGGLVEKRRLFQYIQGACFLPPATGISRAVAKALYGRELTGSITRLEQFAGCACAHFLSYGLHLRERREFKLEIPDMGNLFHNALELFSKKMEEMNLTWQNIPADLRDAIGEDCIEEVAREYGNTILHSSKRNEYIIERMKRILKRTLWALGRQLEKGEFVPGGYELKFSYLDDLESVRIPLKTGVMHLTGRIDRLDLCEREEEIFVKVVDYKTGRKSFDIVDFYYGLQLQLVVYLSAAMEKVQKNNPDKEAVAAGIFYYTIDDPVVERVEPPFIEDAILKELRVNGLVNGDEKVLAALDGSFLAEEGLVPGVKSMVIPVETLKSGAFSKNSSVARGEDFRGLTGYAGKKLKELGNGVAEGRTEPEPYKLGDRTACDYCPYNGVCGFDRKLPGYEYRVLEKKNKDEIWREINGKHEVDSGSEEGN